MKILVSLDGSDLSEFALSHVESLIKDGFAGAVTLLNIVKGDIPWAGMYDEMPFDITETRKLLFARCIQKVSGKGGIPVMFKRDQSNNEGP